MQHGTPVQLVALLDTRFAPCTWPSTETRLLFRAGIVVPVASVTGNVRHRRRIIRSDLATPSARQAAKVETEARANMLRKYQAEVFENIVKCTLGVLNL